jgi:GntR family transcriptional repressor for pyruvate dehydrogenase complex
LSDVTAGKPKKQAARVPKRAEIIASELRRQIIDGTLQEGEHLPPESELVERFGVSRITFREAFRILESEGLISISRGVRKGAVVHRPSVAIAARYMDLILQSRQVSIDDVYATLAVCEPAVVRMVAETATPDMVRQLREHLETTRKAIDDHPGYGLRSAEFHQLLVGLSGLKSLELFIAMLSGVLATYVEASAQPSLQVIEESRERKLQIMAMKTELVDAIAARDAQAAEDIWKRYFSRVREFILRIHPIPMVGNLGRMTRQ